MKQKRFYYSRSTVYGWCVYDRQTHTPVYDACADLLPPVKWDESGMLAESCTMLGSEYEAMKLCRRLNKAYWDYCAERGFED